MTCTKITICFRTIKKTTKYSCAINYCSVFCVICFVLLPIIQKIKEIPKWKSSVYETGTVQTKNLHAKAEYSKKTKLLLKRKSEKNPSLVRENEIFKIKRVNTRSPYLILTLNKQLNNDIYTT